VPESSIVVRPEPPDSSSYTAASRLQAAGLRPAIDLFVRAAEVVPLPEPPAPVLIADYGAATGHNSLLPVGAAIASFRRRMPLDQALMVMHTDVAGNDFSVLFETLATDPDSYLSMDAATFASAVGRSFYGQILPSDSVRLGWSSWAIQWLSRLPVPVPDHVFPEFSAEPQVVSAAARQAATDWHEFLAFRGRELAPGGRLVVLTIGVDESGEPGMRPLVDAIQAALRELTGAGLISAAELTAMTIPMIGRSAKELASPFSPKGRFEGLSIEHLEINDADDRHWQQFRADGDEAGFGARWAAFLRAAVFAPLIAALAEGSADARAAEFADRLERGIAVRMAAAPQPMKITLARVVLLKGERS
jgi:salicylate 1-O-methyltransferase